MDKFQREEARVASLWERAQKEHEQETPESIKPPALIGFTDDEITTARLSPKCIVQNYLYADVALLAAAGGTGKTTTLIYEAVQIALGREVWGCRVETPGKTLFITAEDSRELFGARLREIINALELTGAARRQALSSITVWDVSAETMRVAQLGEHGNIEITGIADWIVSSYRESPPVHVVLDPLVSFGPGERYVNDGDQAVIQAARRIVRGLDCCVRLVSHTGKGNARSGALDQYSARNASALPDGCRMVAIMAAVNETTENYPDGFDLIPGDAGYILARAKLSYSPPQSNIWIRRHGWRFEYFIDHKRTTEQVLTADADKLAAFLQEELSHGRKYTANTLTELKGKLNLPRARLRAALAYLRVNGHVVDAELPPNECQGGKRTYLKVAVYLAGGYGEVPPENTPSQNTTSPGSTTSPPYRENENSEVPAVSLSADSQHFAADNGEVPAKWRSIENGDMEEGEL